MMYRIMVSGIILAILCLSGCGTKQPAEPTPDLQAQIKSQTEMSEWYTNVRYAFSRISQAYDMIFTQIEITQGGGGSTNLQGMFDYFNQPGNLVSELQTQQQLFKDKNTKLSAVKEVNVQTLKNMQDLTKVYDQALELLTKVPQDLDQFKTQATNIKSQFNAIENLLLKDFPSSNADLAIKRSADNPDFRKDQRLLEFIPVQIPTTQTEDTSQPADATGEVSQETQASQEQTPAQVWRDENGVIHMGSSPPEGAQIVEPQGRVSHSGTAPQDTPVPAVPDQTPDPDTQAKSKIWTDADGNLHMGSDAPDGIESKPVDDIPLMISNP